MNVKHRLVLELEIPDATKDVPMWLTTGLRLYPDSTAILIAVMNGILEAGLGAPLELPVASESSPVHLA